MNPMNRLTIQPCRLGCIERRASGKFIPRYFFNSWGINIGYVRLFKKTPYIQGDNNILRGI